MIRKNRNMASNKKINIPIPDLSSKEKYALIDSIESDHEENIDNLMNEFDTKFIGYSLFEVGMRHKDIGQVTQDNTVKANLIPINVPIEGVVTQPQSDDDFEHEKPLCKLANKKRTGRMRMNEEIY